MVDSAFLEGDAWNITTYKLVPDLQDPFIVGYHVPQEVGQWRGWNGKKNGGEFQKSITRDVPGEGNPSLLIYEIAVSLPESPALTSAISLLEAPPPTFTQAAIDMESLFNCLHSSWCPSPFWLAHLGATSSSINLNATRLHWWGTCADWLGHLRQEGPIWD